MKKTAHPSTNPDFAISVADLARYAEGWLLDGEIRQHSKATIGTRRIIVEKLLWFLRRREYSVCGILELRQFLVYLTRGHEEAGGRWGNTANSKPVRPGTVATYHARLRTLFAWIVSEGGLERSPMESVAPPVNRPDQIQPFTQAQVAALLSDARRSTHPRRDEAILLFLLDTGVQASELCTLRMRDSI